MSGPSFDEVREVLEKLPCPRCKADDVMTLTREFHAVKPGTYSVAGHQMKVSAAEMWTARCSACGAGFNVGDAEYAD